MRDSANLSAESGYHVALSAKGVRKMKSDTRYTLNWLGSVLAALAFGLLLCSSAQGQSVPANKVVFQVSDAEPAKWALTMNNVKNIQAELGAKNVEIEIVAYGPGIGMLKVDSVAGNQIRDAIKNGVSVVACENTMKNQKLSHEDMLPTISYAPAGVVQLMKRQQQGWSYIRP
jgi:intracellular sulfur oxidation DsrE/DsrF family protein